MTEHQQQGHGGGITPEVLKSEIAAKLALCQEGTIEKFMLQRLAILLECRFRLREYCNYEKRDTSGIP